MEKNSSNESISSETISESPPPQVLNHKNVVGHILDKFLGDLKGVMIEQKFEVVEAVTRFETQNKYSIDTLKGQNILTAFEESSCILRHCCRSKRPFKMKIYDFDKQEIIRIKRPLKCQNCCCFCCLQRMTVFSPVHNFIGSVYQNFNICRASFTVYDEMNNRAYSIKGPLCRFKMCGHVKYRIFSNGVKVGKITRLWRGLLTEYLLSKVSNADIYEIMFPEGANSKLKALIISSCFLIDFMYFEKRSKIIRRRR